ncbi:FAD-dependent tricarballylate dehydrogenase TcuA [Roseovarius pacificus]|uniref:FAD-dependent tricarballylate dehydrogenase TcuA n=1 Tax=Roseovarius pacificus TaxID=337701 RepID=UPI002A186A90|nr:FAD-dependent tricarballylate dehydrogenase TcuA [Roseovarius pacificus]
MSNSSFDVVVVGGGNAALSSAISAAEEGAKVALLERAPENERGGNSSFTAGAMRFAYEGKEDLQKVMPELGAKEWDGYEFGAYLADDFFQDIARMSQYRTDPTLTEVLTQQSLDTVKWLHGHGVRFLPYRRQGAKVGDKIKWFGGLVVETVGGGIGLVDAEYRAAEKVGVQVFYETSAIRVGHDGSGVTEVVARKAGREISFSCSAVVLACGGFEANAEWRTRYLGPGWDLAKVRGSRYNQGDGLKIALEIGAQSCGNWSGCHAISWDRNAPVYGDRDIGELFSKHSFPYGIVVNSEGKRFLDEGADYYLYTYAKYGQRILQQPGQFAWQIFDAQTKHLLHDEYKIKQITKVQADTIEELVDRIEDVDKEQLLKTIREYNEAIVRDRPLDPTTKDGLAAKDIVPPKSNWATPIEEPPFEAYGVTCGITFTYGGIKINADASVLDVEDLPIPGVYSAGEMVGGIFYTNYPGGSGLTNGAVFGRIAGRSAAHAAASAK